MTKEHMIISLNIERALDKVQHHFIIKSLKKPEIEGNLLNLIKGIYKKLISNSILYGERPTAF